MKLLYLFFICTVAVHAQTISFYPEGPMDKPMPKIEIIEKQPADTVSFRFEKRKQRGMPVFIFLVGKDDLKKIAEFVTANKTAFEYSKSEQYQYGAYRVAISGSGNDIDYMLLSYKESYAFFKKLLPLTIGNDSLNEEIEDLTDRLDKP